MKITELIGKKVLDNDDNDVGKLQDIDIDLEEVVINDITINSNEVSIRKNAFKITPDMISKVGDYILLNVSKSEISNNNNKEKSKTVTDIEIIDPDELESEN